MKHNVIGIIIILFFSACTCTFTFVGLITIKDYKLKKSKQVVEQALIDVQYKYPELRIDKESREKFKTYDISARRGREGGLTKEDSVYLEKYSEDYYRNTFGHKEFEFSSLDKKYLFFVQVLDSAKSCCKLVIESFSEKFDKSYVNSNNLNREKIKEGLQVFDREIWPKIKEGIEDVAKKNN